MVDLHEDYKGSIDVEFRGLPSINLVSIIIEKGANWFERIAEATRRRYFTLEKDWNISVDRVDYQPELNGTILVPKSVDGKPLIFDGASVPMPWLVSFLTIGALRPLGVMLTASIVHDFAFKHGYLLVESDSGGTPKKVEIERHNVDRLFRDIIGTVNQVATIGWIAWFFVRAGWILGVKYNGKRFGGNPPLSVGLISLAVLSFLGFYLFDGWSFQESKFNHLVSFSVLLYLMFYVATLFTLQMRGNR